MINPKENHVIFGVHITERVKHAGDVQKCLTQHGCNIKTRLGLHEISNNYCATSGVLLLEMVGEDAAVDELQEKLSQIEGVEVQRMVFEHP